MADAFYNTFFNHIGNGGIDLDTDTIDVELVDEADEVITLTDEDKADLTAIGLEGNGVLASKTHGTVADGVFDAADTTMSAVSGDVCESLILYKDTGVDTTSWLICNLDSYTGLPVTPNGGDITVAWPSGGILDLG